MPPGRPAIKVVHVSCVVTLLTHPRTRGHTLDSGHSGLLKGLSEYRSPTSKLGLFKE